MRISTHEKRVAKSLGITPAGLSYLSRLIAKGAAPQRGNEVGRLMRDGLIAESDNGGFRNWESMPVVITDAGRDIVRRARELGW